MQNPQEIKQTPLKEALLACKVMVKYVLIFGCIVNLLMLSTPLFSMQVLDRVLSSGNQHTLLMLSLVIILALALLALVQAARAFAMNKMGTWFENKLSHIIFSNSIRSAIESKAMANSQQLRDLQTIKTFLTSPGLIAMMDTPWAIIFIIVLFILHTALGALAILGGVILVLFGILADRATKPLIESNNENFIKSMRQVDQATRNGEVIEVMGFQGNIIKTWQKLNEKVQTTQSLVTKRQALFMECTKFIRLIIQISVTALGAYLVLTDGFSSGGIIAASSLVGRALAPFEAAINSWKGYVTCRKSYDRLTKTLQRHNNVDSLMSLPEPEGKLDVENIFFAPPGVQKHIIKGVNFNVDPGETLAIIGPSASGKTTLAKLIVGIFHPNIGAVRIDNASLRDWKRDELGPHIGYLPQDVELFGGTIKDNIARMDEEASHEDIIVAAQLAGVHEMILKLPMGYDTQIGFDGSVLSGGQKQRIGLARAFYGNPKIIILDEPNASLDSKGEEALSTAIAIAKEQKITTIIISHRTPILNLADKILIMKDGMVASFGPKEQVMQQISKMQQTEQLGAQGK